jgi:CheY-like chemotaxis protein
MLRRTIAQPSILVVDDEPRIADLIGAVVKRCGMRAHVVYSGSDALSALRSVEFDAVVLDWIMPGRTGEQTAALIRHRSPGIKIVVTSGTAGNGFDDAIAAGQIDAFLRKPFTPDALIAVLDYALLGPFRSLVA